MNQSDGQAASICLLKPANPSSGNRGIIPATAFHEVFQRSWFRSIPLAGLLLMTSCALSPQISVTLPEGGEWHEFQGTWTAAGSRSIMCLGGDRRASIGNFEGSLLLAGPSRPAVGFRSEAIVLSDTVTGMVGRAVWTDERGDQAFSELRGEGTSAGNRIVGTFIGGTGRYSGAAGTYEFSWRFLLETEDGIVQGQSFGLKGRVRVGPLDRTHDEGRPQS